MKHDQNICIECAYVGTCDGQPADDCELMNLAEFETALNDRLAKLDDQFSTISDVLKVKKEAFIEMYRKNPKISRDEAVTFLQTTTESFDPANPEVRFERNAMEEQLIQQQKQLVQLQEQLARQQEVSAEAEELRIQLADQKAELEHDCQGLEQRLHEEKEKNQTLFEAIKNLQAREKDLESQLEEKEVARQKLVSEKISLENKWDRRQEDLVQTNNKLVETQQELTNQEQRLNELQSSLSAAEKQNEELQSLLDSKVEEISNLEKELREINEAKFNLEVENEKLNDDLKAMTSSKSETDGKIKELEETFQETQSRLQDAERVNAQQTLRINKLQPVVCNGFSDDNFNVTVSSNRRSVKSTSLGSSHRLHGSYCFLNHPKFNKNQILKWSVHVPKFIRGAIGMVINQKTYYS